MSTEKQQLSKRKRLAYINAAEKVHRAANERGSLYMPSEDLYYGKILPEAEVTSTPRGTGTSDTRHSIQESVRFPGWGDEYSTYRNYTEQGKHSPMENLNPEFYIAAPYLGLDEYVAGKAMSKGMSLAAPHIAKGIKTLTSFTDRFNRSLNRNLPNVADIIRQGPWHYGRRQYAKGKEQVIDFIKRNYDEPTAAQYIDRINRTKYTPFFSPRRYVDYVSDVLDDYNTGGNVLNSIRAILNLPKTFLVDAPTRMFTKPSRFHGYTRRIELNPFNKVDNPLYDDARHELFHSMDFNNVNFDSRGRMGESNPFNDIFNRLRNNFKGKRYTYDYQHITDPAELRAELLNSKLCFQIGEKSGDYDFLTGFGNRLENYTPQEVFRAVNDIYRKGGHRSIEN